MSAEVPLSGNDPPDLPSHHRQGSDLVWCCLKVCPIRPVTRFEDRVGPPAIPDRTIGDPFHDHLLTPNTGQTTPHPADHKARRMSWQADFVLLTYRIRKERLDQGLSQIEAATLIGICERSYRDFEAGKRDLSSSRLFKLAQILGVRIFIS
jgi:DNA-binding XRE family transcriptional regulator